jgi:hypothetical protein
MYEDLSNMNQRDAVSLIFKIDQIKGKDGQTNTLIEHTTGHKIRRVLLPIGRFNRMKHIIFLAGMSVALRGSRLSLTHLNGQIAGCLEDDPP